MKPRGTLLLLLWCAVRGASSSSSSSARALHRRRRGGALARGPIALAVRGGASADGSSGAPKKKKAKKKKKTAPAPAPRDADEPYKIDPTGTPLAARAARLGAPLERLRARHAQIVARQPMLGLLPQLVFTVGASKAVGLLDASSPSVRTRTRLFYLLYIVVAQALVALARRAVLAADDDTSLALPVPPMLKKLAELGQTKTGLPLPMVLQATSGSSTTVKAYDLKASSSS